MISWNPILSNIQSDSMDFSTNNKNLQDIPIEWK